MDRPTDLQLLESLRSRVCPVCGGVKQSMHSFCSGDYFRIPRYHRSLLYLPISSGYAEAIVVAFDLLGAVEFKMPPASGGGA